MFVRLRLPLFEPLMSVVESFFPYSVPFRLFISSFFSHGIHSLFLFFFFSVTVVFCHLHQTPVLLFFFFYFLDAVHGFFFFFESSPIISELLFLVFLFFFYLFHCLRLFGSRYSCLFFFFYSLLSFPPKKNGTPVRTFFFPMYDYQIITLDGQSRLLLFFFFPPSGRRELQTFLSLGREEG